MEGESGGEAVRNPWRLSTVTEVEETKLVLSMVPIWVSALPFGVCVAQVSTFFIKQAAVMDRHLAPRFELPPASIYGIAALGMIVAVAAYDKALEPALRRATGRERGVSILQRIGVGMAFSVLAMAVAAAVERRRLASPRPAAMSVLWLAPQFTLMGFGDGFALVGLQEYFYDQAPDGMRSLGIGVYLSVVGAGSFLSSLLITAADRASARGGRRHSWFAGDLDRSRLDLFYWLLACMSAANLCWYVFVATRYSYKSIKGRRVGDERGTTTSGGDLERAGC